MKKYIILATLALIAVLQLPAQVLVKADGDTVRFESSNPLRKITSQYSGSSITFTFDNGSKSTFNISELNKIEFDKDATTAIEDIKAGKETIVYDEAANKVYVANAKQFTSFVLFNAEGKQLRSVEGNVISLAGLPAGLYIVSYNGVLNAKILKK
jgi:hypothetical protein